MMKLTWEIDELASDVVVYGTVPRSLVSFAASRLRLVAAPLVLSFFAKDTRSAVMKLAKGFEVLASDVIVYVARTFVGDRCVRGECVQ